jgi:homoserine kinase type II
MIEQAKTILETDYSSGEIRDITQLHGGFVNRTYVASLFKDGKTHKWIIRAYNAEVAEREIQFEHALIGHLRKNGFHLAADVIPAKNGSSYLSRERRIKDTPQKTLWAVFEFLEGDDRYTWDDTHVAAADMKSAAGVLADLHQASLGFESPKGIYRDQPKIMPFLSTFRASHAGYAKTAGKGLFDRRFLQEMENIQKAAAWATIEEADGQGLPTLGIHCDFHQGNLKYRGSDVVGVFDFDWSKIDLRLFDVALAIYYFCGNWGGQGTRDDCLNLDKLALFLGSYGRRCRALPDLEPFNHQEKTYLPHMLAAANLYVLQWTINDYYTTTDPDEDQYRTYFEHGVGIMNRIPDQVDRIHGIAAQAG